MDKRAIGVFDSGLGGLTTVKELAKILPDENIVYFGDTSRVPYGTRSRETIMEYAKQDIQFLLSKDVKMVIAACGTASTVLLPPFTDTFDFLFSGVVLPTALAAVEATETGEIGILATPASIRSKAYEKAICVKDKHIKVFSKECPMLVPLVENGYIEPEDPVANLIVAEYLACFQNTKVDTIILGCTHYPIIKRTIAKYVDNSVRLIDSGKETARFALSLLQKHDLLNEQKEKGICSFYVSDSADSFAENAKIFLGDLQVKAEKVNVQG